MGDSLVNLIKSGLQNELVLVEYPGLVKNEEKMLKTLGGINKISSTFCNEKRRLELRFHPDNIYNKPTSGDSSYAAGLLIKVKIRRKKDPTNSEPLTHTVEILGKCSKAYKFNSLCDFQYLPLYKNPQTDHVENIYDKIVPKKILENELFSNPDCPLFCPPTSFSRNDTVYTKLHRGDRDLKCNLSNDEVIGIVRGKNEGAEFISFSLTEPFPEKPNPQVVKKLQVKYVSDKQFEKIRSLFDECPIWNRVALIYESGVSHDKMKVILPSVAYYFTTGPWRTMYVRFGYDPRKDFQSRLYQAFDFRYRFKTGIAQFVKTRAKAMSDTYAGGSGDPSSSNQTQNTRQNVFYPYYEEGTLPRSRQCIFRYCDLHIPKIQDMLKKIPSPKSGAICNEKSGWLPLCFDDEVRQIIANLITEHIKNLHQLSKSSDTQSEMEDQEIFDEESYEEEIVQDENMDDVESPAFEQLEQIMEIDDDD